MKKKGARRVEKDLVDLQLKIENKIYKKKVPKNFKEAWICVFGEFISREEVFNAITETFRSKKTSSNLKIKHWRMVFYDLSGYEECRKFLVLFLKNFLCLKKFPDHRIEMVRKQVRYFRSKKSPPENTEVTKSCYK